MSNNALIKLQGGDIELSDAERLILAEMEQDEAAYDLQPARVKIAPGGIGQFILGDETAKSFTAIVALSQKIRGYWPDSGTGSAPLCSSPDGTHGIFTEPTDEQWKAAGSTKTPHPAIPLLNENKPLPDTFACVTCPMNQWGSEHQRRGGAGKGKACKEMRRLLLLIEGWSAPAIMSLPPTSLKVWDNYCSALNARKNAYFAVRTKFTLDSAKAAGGETYNVVQVAQSGAITDVEHLQAVAAIRKEYREFVSAAPIVADEYDTPIDDGSADAEMPF